MPSPSTRSQDGFRVIAEITYFKDRALKTLKKTVPQKRRHPHGPVCLGSSVGRAPR